jgi:hypothetical protein
VAQLGDWLVDHREDIRAQVRIREGRRDGELKTLVDVDHRFTCAAAKLGRLHVRARRTFLPRAQFSSETRVCIGNAARSDAGRVLYCEDQVLGEVIAVLSFHIDRRSGHPVLITAIGLRTDVENNPSLAARSLAAGLVLKHYVHAVSELIGRGGHVDLDLADRSHLELMRELGFRPAPRVPGFDPGGTHLRQPAPA